MGHPQYVNTPELEEAFRRDWDLGLTLRELGALYGFTNINSVTRVARRLGCPPRPGGREPVRLTGGEWVVRHGVQYWVEDSSTG